MQVLRINSKTRLSALVAGGGLVVAIALGLGCGARAAQDAHPSQTANINTAVYYPRSTPRLLRVGDYGQCSARHSACINRAANRLEECWNRIPLGAPDADRQRDFCEHVQDQQADQCDREQAACFSSPD